LAIAHQAGGEAITIANSLSFTKSFDINAVISAMHAPNTFITPIPLLHCLVINEDKAINPRQAMTFMYFNQAKKMPVFYDPDNHQLNLDFFLELSDSDTKVVRFHFSRKRG